MALFTKTTSGFEATQDLGRQLGEKLQGGEVIELISDLGGGKTTFVSGLAKGFGSTDAVASPSFTISSVYTRPDKKALHHFDFYRLEDPGIVASELAELEEDPSVVVAVEWGAVVHDVLPDDRIIVEITVVSEDTRNIQIKYSERFSYLFST